MTAEAIHLGTHRTRRAAHLAVLADLAAERGLSACSLFAGTRLQASGLASARGEVFRQDEIRLIRNLVGHCGNAPGLGFACGRRYRFTIFDELAHAIARSPTLRHALEAMSRCAEVDGFFLSASIESHRDDLCLSFAEQEEDLPQDVRRFVLERDMSHCLALAADLLGFAVRPVHVELARADDRQEAARYEPLFGVMPWLGSTRDALILRRVDADRSLESFNLSGICLARAAERHHADLQIRGERVTERVMRIIAREPARMSDMQAVASALCMSDRTLRRRLRSG